MLVDTKRIVFINIFFFIVPLFYWPTIQSDLGFLTK
jgi:hypothetical protein